MATAVRVLTLGLMVLGLACMGGCAATPDAITTVRNEGDALPGRLLAPQIVVGEGSIDLQGPELTPDARARFREERTARISQRSRPNPVPALTAGDAVGACLYAGIRLPVVGLLACPIALPLGYVTVHLGKGVEHGVRYAVVSMLEPRLRLSAEQADRVTAALTERATSAALVERALYAAPSEFVEGAEAKSRLVIRIKAAQTCEAENAVAICLIAEARGYAAHGAALSPTEHVFVHGPLMPLLAEDDGRLERTIEEGLDLLAESIVAAYTWTGPLANVPQEAAPEAMPAPLAPVVGDSWTYRLTEPGRTERTHRITVVSASASGIRERRDVPEEDSAEEERAQGAYLLREGRVSLFSPYLVSFEPEDLAKTKVKNLDPRFCDVRWFCTTTARLAGTELVRVPAGEFHAFRVELQQAWSPRFPGPSSGERTLTVWYSPHIKRAVKFSSRGTRSEYLRTEFDLELVEFTLKSVAR